MILKLVLMLLACYVKAAQPTIPDLCIRNATVFMPDGDTLPDQWIWIDNGRILKIEPENKKLRAKATIDAHGRLVTPGFFAIDEHLDDMLGDSIGRLTMQVDSFEVYRRRLSELYLPFGITTVRTSGDAEEWLELAVFWMRYPRNDAPDFYPSGGSMVSPYEGKRYVNHCFLADQSAAIQKLKAYEAIGIRHVKLYGNLNIKVFKAALRAARKRGMSVSAQVQNATSFDETLDLGLQNFEQVATLFYDRSVLDFWGDSTFNATVATHWAAADGDMPGGGSRIYPFLEAARFVGKDNPKVMRLLKKMKANGAGMVPCLHFFAQWLGKTWFCSTPKARRFDVSDWSNVQMKRCREGYEVLAYTTLQMHEMGIPLRIGTDHKDGGKAVLSEMLLLHDAGIPMRDVLRIATRNSAEAIALGHQVGTIATGKKAHLIIWNQNPLVDAQNLLGSKIVLKDGVLARESN